MEKRTFLEYAITFVVGVIISTVIYFLFLHHDIPQPQVIIIRDTIKTHHDSIVYLEAKIIYQPTIEKEKVKFLRNLSDSALPGYLYNRSLELLSDSAGYFRDVR